MTRLKKHARLVEIKAFLNEAMREIEEMAETPGDLLKPIERTARLLDSVKAGLEAYFVLFENAVQGVFIGTLEGEVIDCNPAFAKMMGHDFPDELVGLKDFGTRYYYNPGDRLKMIEMLKRKKVLKNVETRLKARDGKKSIRWVRAGHDPAFLYDPESDRFSLLEGPGVVLGVDENITYTQNQAPGLARGQILAIGTDGIWESRNQAREMFGKDRFCNVIRENAGKSAREILDAVYTEVAEFSLGLKPEDDITLVVIKAL